MAVLRSNLFSPKQLYIALAQVKKSASLFLFHNPADSGHNAVAVPDIPFSVVNPVLMVVQLLPYINRGLN